MPHILFSRFAVVAAAGIASLAACGTSATSTPTTSAATSPPSARTTTTAIATATPTAPALESLRLTPAGFGPLKLGMTKQEAAATGVVDADVPSIGCASTFPLLPRAPYTASFDVLLDKAGRVRSIGGNGANFRTSTGIHAGSTLAEVQHAYPAADAPRDPGGDAAAYHPSGVFVREGDNYLGLLFENPPNEIKATDEVTFMEIAHGRPPGLFRDGC